MASKDICPDPALTLSHHERYPETIGNSLHTKNIFFFFRSTRTFFPYPRLAIIKIIAAPNQTRFPKDLLVNHPFEQVCPVSIQLEVNPNIRNQNVGIRNTVTGD